MAYRAAVLEGALNLQAAAAWLDLAPGRPAGLGLTALPLVEIEAWARIHGRAGPELPEMVHRVRLIDRAFIEAAQKHKPQQAAGKAPKLRAPGRR